MIYVVTGFPRSGTSMMMQALKAGGLPIHYDRQRERKLRSDYKNDNRAFFEIADGEAEDIRFPLECEGKAFKILGPWVNLGNLAVSRYKMLFMKRNPREIAVSLAYLFGGAIPRGDHENLLKYEALMNKGVQIAQNRRDVESVVVVGYDAVLQNPSKVFGKLQQEVGWPIDPEKAAAVINPKRQRVVFKSEDDTGPYRELIASMGSDKTRVRGDQWAQNIKASA